MIFQVARVTSAARTALLKSYGSARAVPAWGYASLRSMASWPKHKVVGMPALSPTMEQGTIAQWLKEEGDAVASGDALCEIETDKSTLSFEYTGKGHLAKILIEGGTSDVKVGTPIAVITRKADDVAAFASFSAADAGGDAEAPAASEEKSSAETAAPAASGSSIAPAAPASASAVASAHGDRVIASPLARKTAREEQVDLSSLSGTGPNGRVIRADVMDAVAAGAAKQAVAQPAFAAAPTSDSRGVQDIPLSGMRKTIARRLVESKQQVPHYYLTIDCRIDDLLAARAKLNAESNGAFKLSVNDFLIKAAAASMEAVPAVNSSWADTVIRQPNYVDVSVAVATESGLMTPIVKDADIKGLKSIAADVRDLAERARTGSLQPDEYQGGTFTISNLGMFGIKNFSAIINPPQSCILAVGGARRELVPKEGTDPKNPEVEVATLMSVTLSCDHRVVDGAVGAQWLQEFRSKVEDPLRMLL